MPSVWTRSADELHREYVANTEAFYRAAGRSCAAELDGFMRKCALWLWKSSPAVTQAHVDAYNALCSKGREPGDALLWDLTGKVCSAQAALPPMFVWSLAERDVDAGRDNSRVFARMVTNILLSLAAADGEVSRAEAACIADIALEFGCEYINMDGTLNRRKMARTVFGDKAKLKKLNSLMFPYIIEEIRGELARLKEEQGGLIVLDAPTLFESGADKECDYVVSVTAAAPERERRIIARDGLSQEEARERIAAQHDEDYYKSRSWRVLENNGSADSLKNEVSALLATLEGMMEQPASAPDKEDIL